MAALTPTDIAGAETLEVLRDAYRYNAWQYSRIAPYLGRRVCEIGAGIGNISSLIIDTPRDIVVLTDTDPYYQEELRRRFSGRADVEVVGLTLPDITARQRFQPYDLDTVVALNVVEHIDDDVGALQSMAGLLSSGGRAVILVPALDSLYGTLDEELGHCRRYTKRALASRMRDAGFRLEAVFFFNLVGSAGWWVNSRLLRRRRISAFQLRAFEFLVPLLRLEDRFRLPFGQSLVAIGTAD